MKKFSLISIIVVLALALAACGGAGDDQSGNGAGDNLATDTGSSIVTEEVGGGLGNEGAATQDLSGGMATEEVPALGSTEVGSMATQSAGGAGTTVPDTGANATSVPGAANGAQFGEFARLGDLIGMSLAGANTSASGAGNDASATQQPTMEATAVSGGSTSGSDANTGSGANTGVTGSSMGAIQDFVINVAKARVDYIVVDRGGQSVLVPWSTLAFDRDNNGGFTFNGQSAAFENAPVFSASDFDFSNQNWDADVLNAWRNGGINTNNGGVVVATGQPGVGSVSGTAVPTTNAGSQLSATQQSTATVGSNEVHNGPVFSNDMVAVLYTDLVSKQVVQGNSSDSVNGSDSANSATQSATQMPLSTGEANATPAAGSNTGSNVQSGQAVGQIVDAVVNVTTGDVPYLLLSTSGDFASNNTSGSGNNAGATVQPGMEATNSSATVQPTMEATAGSGSNAGSNSGSAMGSSNVDGTIPVPMRFFRFQEDSIVLVFPANLLSGAPVYNASEFSGPMNFGWDTTFQTFWTQNGGATNP